MQKTGIKTLLVWKIFIKKGLEEDKDYEQFKYLYQEVFKEEFIRNPDSE